MKLGFLMQDLSGLRKGSQHCEGCGVIIPVRVTKKVKHLTPGEQSLCKTCARVWETYPVL